MKFFSAFVLLLATSTIASAALMRSFAGSDQSLAINGVAAPEVISWSGADIVGSVTTQPTTGKKHINSVSYAPLVVESRLPLSPALADCLADLLANRATPRTLSLNTQDASGKGTVTSTIHAANAILEEVRFPKLDASAKDSVVVTFVFRVENTKDAALENSAPLAKRSSAAMTSNFRLTIDGLPSNRIASVEALTIKRGAPGKAVDISDLSVAISSADEAGWIAWNESFLIKGDNQDSSEKTGTLELLSADLKTPLLSLKLSNLGLIRLASPQTAPETISRFNAHLYCESISLSPPATSGTKPAPDVRKASDISPSVKRALGSP